MPLVRLHGRVVQPHGDGDPTPVVGDGTIILEWRGANVLDGAVHGRDRATATYVAGVLVDAYLRPGAWAATVHPTGLPAWTMSLGIPDDIDDVTLADALGVEVDGTIITKGDKGDPGEPGTEGVSVTGAEDLGGAFALALSDGTTTAPIAIPGAEGSVTGIPIFATLAEAQAWEAANPGRTALTLEEPIDPPDPDTEVTPAAVTFNDVARTYTVPATTGVRYLLGSATITAGTYPVGDAARTVTITAQAEDGYVLVGTATWSHSWAAKPIEPTVTVLDLAAQDSAVHAVHFTGGTVQDAGTDGATWTATDVPLGDGIATFNGTSSRLTSTTTTGGTYGSPAQLTVIAVCTPTASASNAPVLAHSYAELNPSDASKRQYAAVRGSGAVALASTANTAATGVRACVAWRYDGTVGLEAIRNGVRLAGPSAGTGPLTAVASTPVYIGSKNASTFFTGTVEYVIVVRGALTDARLLEYAQAAGTA